jgi:hypothetical protein
MKAAKSGGSPRHRGDISAMAAETRPNQNGRSTEGAHYTQAVIKNKPLRPLRPPVLRNTGKAHPAVRRPYGAAGAFRRDRSLQRLKH